MDRFIAEVEAKLAATCPKMSAQELGTYQKYMNTKLRVYGHRIPCLRKMIQEGFSFCDPNEQNALVAWDYIWHYSHSFEAKYLAVLYFETLSKKKKDLIYAWPYLKKWAAKLDNWAHSDCLSSIYSTLNERYPGQIYPTLKIWNQSTNPWLRRQSLVSLIYYANLREKHPGFKKVISLIRPLIKDQEHYVQKAVGWTLRELSRDYPQGTIQFIEGNLKNLSPYAFKAATEKLPPYLRQRFKMKRKNIRTLPILCQGQMKRREFEQKEKQ